MKKDIVNDILIIDTNQRRFDVKFVDIGKRRLTSSSLYLPICWSNWWDGKWGSYL